MQIIEMENEMEKVCYIMQGEHEDFDEIFSKLYNTSTSIQQCLSLPDDGKDEDLEGYITKTLAENVLYYRLTGNAEGWNHAAIDVSAYGVTYSTGGGLSFGWRVLPRYNFDTREKLNLCVFCYANPGGTMERSLLKNGFVKGLISTDRNMWWTAEN